MSCVWFGSLYSGNFIKPPHSPFKAKRAKGDQLHAFQPLYIIPQDGRFSYFFFHLCQTLKLARGRLISQLWAFKYVNTFPLIGWTSLYKNSITYTHEIILLRGLDVAFFAMAFGYSSTHEIYIHNAYNFVCFHHRPYTEQATVAKLTYTSNRTLVGNLGASRTSPRRTVGNTFVTWNNTTVSCSLRQYYGQLG